MYVISQQPLLTSLRAMLWLYASRAESWVLALGWYGATIMHDKFSGASVSPDEKYSITIKLITIKLYFQKVCKVNL